MDSIHAIRILREDHKRLKGLFRQVESLLSALPGMSGANESGMARSIIDELFTEIEIHATLEEQIFYPALISALREKRASGSSPVDLDPSEVDCGLREHREVRETLHRLRQLPAGGREFTELLAELAESIEVHLIEEEATLLPEAELLLERDIEDLGAQMRNLRLDLIKHLRGEGQIPAERTTAA